MNFPSSLRERAKKVGQHEAGHWLVAKILGFKPGSISIEYKDLNGTHKAHAEMTLYQTLSNISDITSYLERRVQVLYAGVLSESLVEGKIDNDYAINASRQGGKSDFDKSGELIQLVRNIKHPCEYTEDEIHTQLNSIDHELWNLTAEIVEKHAAHIQGIGSRLSSELKKIGEPYILTESEICSMPALKDLL